MKATIKQLLLFFTFSVAAFTSTAGTLSDSTDTKKRKWYAPDALTLQYAGNLGMFSGGANYKFLHDKLNAELLYGYVPRFDAEEALHLLSFKVIYKPLKKVELGNDFTLTPLRANLAVSYHFRSQFSSSWDSSYPENYYWWISSFRMTGGLGTAINKRIDVGHFKEISLYGEVGTYDLIVTSAVKDKTVTAWDIMSFGVGTSLSF
ncbi:hypothetical protein [Pontibacter pudoricolor]|uniref:hypothetical protein n=1 Tax=Pontibacter pudoricolor TaxID=2694930 RepID=UPI001390C925|nr:hypothetical protein [Pontibacter pudoricolor]